MSRNTFTSLYLIIVAGLTGLGAFIYTSYGLESMLIYLLGILIFSISGTIALKLFFTQ